ncbi:hypothetical protein NQ117_00270 [Paenibacillus sp. SC116]|uniref:DUF7507 domain-containing protein n=1 Tax=Paenibacillus sp. SC116 TaxID=2968986 RepID=UPI00215AAB4E|nr:hypothetical protein [Paenibacillus sp. SC116]MCR8842108.1 hypothetical protein [Paenibacillus sp. SC116]
MPFIVRFSDNDVGAITFTGNTLGLSGLNGTAGTQDFIGALVTTNTAVQLGNFPPGTTNDFNLDNSSAILRLPPGSSILYAELVWAGTYAVLNGTTNFEAFIDKSVSITTPQNTTLSVAPDPATAQLLFINGNFNYFRSANVTSIIQSGGAGTYTVGGVVGNIENIATSSGNHCGWTLCVVYKDPTLPFRNLSLNVGIVDIEFASTPSVDFPVTGFSTPVTGPVTGRVQLCAGDGDANKSGDQVLFGPNTSSLNFLSGPNNLQNNFFASQMNNDTGNQDTSGTFGTRNMLQGAPGANVVAGRQGWDITNVNISNFLGNSQNSAVLQLRTQGDGYSIYALGLYFDINAPQINVKKSVNVVQAAVGDTLTYTVTVTNTGIASANSTVVVDPLPNNTQLVPGSVLINGSSAPAGSNPAVGIPVGTLATGQSVTVTFSVTVTSIPPSGVISNQASARFQFESVPGVITNGDIPSNEVDVPILAPALSLTKTAVPLSGAPGDTITYTFVVTNTGSVTLTNVRLADDVLGLIDTISSLAPGATSTFNVDFVLPFLPVGSLTNTATATSDQTGPVTDTATVIILPSFNLSITKTPDRFSGAPGDVVTYTLTVTNNSNAPLTNVTVNDSLTGFTTTIPTLAAGAVQTFTETFTIPAAATAGTTFTNVATATSNETPPASDQTTVVVTPVPSLIIVKTVDQATAAPGDIVNYTITVTNAGNETLTNVRIVDPVIGVDQTFDALDPGDTVQIVTPFTIPITAVQGDVLVNTATVTSNQTPPEQANAVVTVIGDPAIVLTKSVAPTEASPGSTVTYTFVVTNSGNTPLSNVSLIDPLLGLNQSLGTLAVGETRTVNFPFVVPNITITPFVNVATASGSFGPQLVTDTASASLEILIPNFTLTKSVDRAQANPGDTVNFTFVITNTGNVTLTNVVISDPLLSYLETINQLAPGATVTETIPFDIPENALAGTVFTNTVTVTPTEIGPKQASVDVTVNPAPAIDLTKTPDVDNGLPGDTITYTITVTNTGNQTLTSVGVSDELLGLNAVIPSLAIGQSQTFTVTFVIPPGTPIGTVITNVSTAVSDQTDSVQDTAHVLVNPLPPVITIVKTADRLTAAPGETVNYTFTVTNAGTVTLTNVLVTDEILGVSQPIGTLDPGAVQSFSFPFIVPLNAEPGSTIINTAVVTSDQTNPEESTTTVTVISAPGLTISKSLDTAQASPGQTVTATVTVRNTGNVDLTNVSVTDPTLGFSTIVPLLPAGTTQVYTLPFEVPFVPAGTVITNTATVTSDQTGPRTSTASFTVLAQFQLNLTKTVDPTTAGPGDTVTFTFTLQNLSNAELTNLRFVDELLGIERSVDVIPAGFTIVTTRTFTIPADALGGSVILNTATLTSDETNPVTVNASVTVTSNPELTISKIVQPTTAFPGETVFFRMEGINTGNVPLTNIRYSDPLLGLSGVVLSQDVGAIQSLIVPFVVPPTAVPGSEIVNTVLVASDQTPLQSTTATIRVTGFPLTVTKQASCKTVFVGDKLTFTITVTNSSEVPITSAVLTDLLQTGTKFNPGSVQIGNRCIKDADPERGINLGAIAPGQTVVVSFCVKQKIEPPSKKLRNSATVSFLLEGAAQPISVVSNTVVVSVEEHSE